MAAQDPYFEVKSEIETTLVHLSSLLALPTNVSASDRAYNHSELLGTLISLEADLEELEESVHAVEEEGVARRLGIAREEVARRRSFVERVRGVVRLEARKRLSAQSGGQPPPSYRSYGEGEDDTNEGGANNFEMEHQTRLSTTSIEQQADSAKLNGACKVLYKKIKVANSCSSIVPIVPELIINITNVGSPSSWCIFILIAILSALLIIILFF
ncbi:hypothetical protein P7C70_g258, partial [Phenoliferia sp. Uapishka_3]